MFFKVKMFMFCVICDILVMVDILVKFLKDCMEWSVGWK